MYHQMPLSLKSRWMLDQWNKQLQKFLKLENEVQSKEKVCIFAKDL